MKSNLSINVLLVEDDKELAASVAEFLEFENIKCDHAYNGLSGFTLAKQNYYDVIILDLMLPKIDGFTVCERLRDDGDDTPILMLTAKDTLQDKEAGFNAGTDDYLIKPFAMKELALRIKALSKRRSSQQKRLVRGDLVYDLQNQQVSRSDQILELNRLNRMLLELLMRRSPQVVSRSEIEECLWPNDAPESNNIKVQVYQLRQKIDKPFESNLIETVVGQGLRIKEQP
ncbi:response regulator transcription factor [Vibrio splendidus]|uniref:response regulator transcription factor n=1 Tax=Vibrio splendidus TaxID=29497 RepID=UPI000D3C1297|nr:response regulator transcription factor [Vibrio splendidus]MCW4438983.1 response regulator transcription factor [Vibrio splendidus]PTP84227.1 two-component system response regulator [Vibrio splendidus]